jgi:methylglutaconyl-CoA hydratase
VTVLDIENRGAVRWLWLNRPEVRNAFNPELIAAITRAFADIETDASVRVVVVAARGAAFCAGADLHWMRSMAGFSHAENQADALSVARMFNAVHRSSRPVIARVQGDAFGGGVGLAAACDIAVAVDSANFVLSEVKLGLVAATIAPHVLRALGERQARRYLLSAEKFSTARAQELGLVHDFASPEKLDALVESFIQSLLAASPAALAATKNLLADIGGRPLDAETLAVTAKCIADARVSAEGREGIAAFLEKRAPGWLPPK